MSKYEFAFLSDNQKNNGAIDDILTSFKGKKLKETVLGKKYLAYPIDKKTEADLIVWDIEIDKDKVASFKQKIIFDNLTIRYLLTEKTEVKTKKLKIKKNNVQPINK